MKKVKKESYYQMILFLAVGLFCALMLFGFSERESVSFSPTDPVEQSLVISLECGQSYPPITMNACASRTEVPDFRPYDGIAIMRVSARDKSSALSLCRLRLKDTIDNDVPGHADIIRGILAEVELDSRSRCNSKLTGINFVCPQREICDESGGYAECPLSVEIGWCATTSSSMDVVGVELVKRYRNTGEGLWNCVMEFNACAEGTVAGSCGGCAAQ